MPTCVVVGRSRLVRPPYALRLVLHSVDIEMSTCGMDAGLAVVLNLWSTRSNKAVTSQMLTVDWLAGLLSCSAAMWWCAAYIHRVGRPCLDHIRHHTVLLEFGHGSSGR